VAALLHPGFQRALLRVGVQAAAWLVSAVLAANPVAAQTVVTGTVLESDTGLPVFGVELRLLTPDGQVRAATTTATDGTFRMELQDGGTYSLSVRRLGYATVVADDLELSAGDPVELEVTLSPQAVGIAPVTVVARRLAVPANVRRFRERAEQNQGAGGGRFYTREDIERIRPNSPQELLGPTLWAPGCSPVILLDGVPTTGPIHGMTAANLEGIEIYRRPEQIPLEFYRDGMCGLALVWTRIDPEGLRPVTWARAAVAGVIVALLALLLR
jgi:hypothetical protein